MIMRESVNNFSNALMSLGDRIRQARQQGIENQQKDALANLQYEKLTQQPTSATPKQNDLKTEILKKRLSVTGSDSALKREKFEWEKKKAAYSSLNSAVNVPPLYSTQTAEQRMADWAKNNTEYSAIISGLSPQEAARLKAESDGNSLLKNGPPQHPNDLPIQY